MIIKDNLKILFSSFDAKTRGELRVQPKRLQMDKYWKLLNDSKLIPTPDSINALNSFVTGERDSVNATRVVASRLTDTLRRHMPNINAEWVVQNLAEWSPAALQKLLDSWKGFFEGEVLAKHRNNLTRENFLLLAKRYLEKNFGPRETWPVPDVGAGAGDDDDDDDDDEESIVGEDEYNEYHDTLEGPVAKGGTPSPYATPGRASTEVRAYQPDEYLATPINLGQDVATPSYNEQKSRSTPQESYERWWSRWGKEINRVMRELQTKEAEDNLTSGEQRIYNHLLNLLSPRRPDSKRKRMQIQGAITEYHRNDGSVRDRGIRGYGLLNKAPTKLRQQILRGELDAGNNNPSIARVLRQSKRR